MLRPPGTIASVQIDHRHQSAVYRLGVESDHEAELTINITIAGVRWGRVYK